MLLDGLHDLTYLILNQLISLVTIYLFKKLKNYSKMTIVSFKYKIYIILLHCSLLVDIKFSKSENSTLNFLLNERHFQGFHTLRELREFRDSQGIFKLKKISGKLRKTQGISGNFDLFFKLRETQGSFDFF